MHAEHAEFAIERQQRGTRIATFGLVAEATLSSTWPPKHLAVRSVPLLHIEIHSAPLLQLGTYSLPLLHIEIYSAPLQLGTYSLPLLHLASKSGVFSCWLTVPQLAPAASSWRVACTRP